MAVKLKTGRSARVYHTQQVHYLHKTFYTTELPTSTETHPAKISVGVLPANCLPLETYVRVNVAFSSGDILVGTSAAGSSGAVVSTMDLASGTTGVYVVDRYMGTYTTADVPLYVQTATTGQSTAGVADIWVAYLPVLPTT
jgi:hypothetical protein